MSCRIYQNFFIQIYETVLSQETKYKNFQLSIKQFFRDLGVFISDNKQEALVKYYVGLGLVLKLDVNRTHRINRDGAEVGKSRGGEL